MKTPKIAQIAIVLFSLSANAQSELTIQPAVEKALSAHPSVKAAHERVNEARSRRSSAVSTILPTVSGTARGMQRKDAFNGNSLLFGGETYNFYDVGLVAEQPVFRGGGFLGGLKYHGAEVETREKELEIAKRDMTLATIRAFYELLIAQKKVETLERTIKVQSDQLRRTESRLRVGMSRRLDIFQMRASLASLKPRLLEAQTQRTLHAAQLASILSLKDQSSLKVTGSLEPVKVPSATPNPQSGVARPEIARANLSVEMAEAQKTIEMAKHWPSLSLFAEWGRNA
ncbi:MAG TPA: TolC family protein, partial [Bdellovibrionales bacterium]|nr:TolC family protein [Bdellovibrionales bacterium]